MTNSVKSRTHKTLAELIHPILVPGINHALGGGEGYNTANVFILRDNATNS